jgi:prepilin-type N-terminal cleavage/methylation domain-containing protein
MNIMKTHQPGFTLVEFLVVSVLAAIVMGAAYQSLIVQEQGYRATGEIIRGQNAMRISLGVLEAELREVTTAGPTIGVGDIVAATRDSVVVRAQRGLGFVCEVLPSDRRMTVWSISALNNIANDDVVLVFRDNVVTSAADDRWVAARATNVQASTADCPTKPGSPVAHQRINLQTLAGQELDEQLLVGVRPGAPIRSLHRVTYGLYPAGGGWALSRRDRDGTLHRLVDGLAGPGEGIIFTYLDADGATLVEPINPQNVAAIRVTATTRPPERSRVQPVTLTSHIHFRNN